MTNTPENQGRITHRAAAKERGLEALKLRRQGYDYQTIADKLGYATKASAWTVVNRLLAAEKREASAGIVELELQRLDEMQAPMYRRALTGNPAAVDRVLKIMERRAKYLNLDNPQNAAAVQEGVTLLQALGEQLRKQVATDDDTDGYEAPTY